MKPHETLSAGKAEDTVARILTRFKEAHGDKYDYSASIYINSTTPISIRCQVHGEFLQLPNNHYSGKGCYECGKHTTAYKLTLNEKDVFSRFKSIHGDQYCYSRAIYTGYHSKVIILCQHHGEFQQVVATHIDGSGCPTCALDNHNSKYYNEPTILYFLKAMKNGKEGYKIGITLERIGVTKRYKSATATIELLDSVVFKCGKEAYDAEHSIITACSNERLRGVEILESGNTELFSVNILKEKYGKTLKELKDEDTW